MIRSAVEAPMADPPIHDPYVLSPLLHDLEGWVVVMVGWLRLGIELFGAAVVAVGLVMAVIGVIRELSTRRGASFHHVRLGMARYLALALEFQLAADILATAIAPSWDQIGKLGAVAVIRTGLNLFLMHEVKAVRAEEREDGARPP
jgi:uncharacterized membrane protein